MFKLNSSVVGETRHDPCFSSSVYHPDHASARKGPILKASVSTETRDGCYDVVLVPVPRCQQAENRGRKLHATNARDKVPAVGKCTPKSVRHEPIPLSTAHWDLFLSIEQSPSLVDRKRNDHCAFGGETAVPHSAVCRRHDSGAELLLRVGQNVVVICGSTTPDASCHSSTCGCEPIPALRLRSRSISSVSLCSASVAVDS